MRTRPLFVGVWSIAVLLAWAGRARPVAHTPCTAPRIHIVKHQARLELVCDEGTHLYPVTFGAAPVGTKVRRGDERTPEGRYHVSAAVKNDRFHRFLKLSYPSERDRQRAHAAGVDPGGGVGIHGVRESLAGVARVFIRSAGALSAGAWGPTDGCIGMTNEDVEEVYEAAPVGTEVLIEP